MKGTVRVSIRGRGVLRWARNNAGGVDVLSVAHTARLGEGLYIANYENVSIAGPELEVIVVPPHDCPTAMKAAADAIERIAKAAPELVDCEAFRVEVEVSS